MQIRNHVRTLALASALVLSTVSPLAVHVSAADNQGSGSGSSTTTTCGTTNTMTNVYTQEKYKDGGTVNQNTKVHDSSDNKDWVCSSDGSWHEAMIITRPTRIRPVAPSAGAIFVP